MNEQLWDSHVCGFLIVLPVQGKGEFGWCPVCGALFEREVELVTKKVPEWSRRIQLAEGGFLSS